MKTAGVALILVLAGLLAAPLAAAPASGKSSGQSALRVEVTGFRNARGTVRVALYTSDRGFPGEYKKALRGEVLRVKKGKGQVTFAGLAPGIYAVSVLHDENSNGKLDTNWLGIPKEGVGVSRNPSSWFGPPDFDDAKVKLGPKPGKIAIRMKYF